MRNSRDTTFRGLDKDIEGSAKRWKKFIESEQPEREKFPQEWKNKTGLQKLCMMRALRPDRMTHAIRYISLFLIPTSAIIHKLFKSRCTQVFC